MKKKNILLLIISIVCILTITSGCSLSGDTDTEKTTVSQQLNEGLPQYESSPYVAVNNNVPDFSEDEKAMKKSFETYSDLDELGRCGVAFSLIGEDIMPTGERGEIGQVKPSGWKTAKYDCVDGKYLYNRCHLIGWQLTGENANEKNLVTGTRYMNVDGMLPFENMVDDYIEETGNHVLYRVTPYFEDTELVCRGVQIEAYSVEDDGDGICFNVYCFNVQPGVKIDYQTGASSLENEKITTSSNSKTTYIINTSSKKFHLPDCSSVKTISPENKAETKESRDSLLAENYSPCGSCKP